MRIALRIAYDGGWFRGFARQPRVRTVQGAIEEALSRLLRTEVRTVGAGRTDAGVHAAGQVVSLEGPDGTDPAWLLRRLNRMVGPQISVRASAAVPDEFDARFSAIGRTYEYRVYRDPTPDPFLDAYALHVSEPLDLRAMRAGAQALVGEHDFASFCRSEGGRPTRRRVRRLAISNVPAGRLTIRIEADSFCQQMVRSIAGLLLDVGRERRRPADVAKVLRARRRDAAGHVAPPRALHLVAVRYRPDPFARRPSPRRRPGAAAARTRARRRAAGT